MSGIAVTITENSNVITPDTTSTMLVIGVSSGGTVNTPYTLSTPTAVLSTLVSGKGAEFMSSLIRVSKRQHIFVPITPDTAATWGSVTETPAGPGPTITLSGTPLDDYSLAVKIVTAGTRGVATFKVALDGYNYGPVILTAATYVVPGTGTTLNFPNTSDYVADTVYTADVVGASWLAATTTTAINAARTAGLQFGGIVVLNEGTTTVSTIVAQATGLAADIATLRTTYSRDVIGYLGCNYGTSDANVAASGFTSIYSNRSLCVSARDCYMVSGINPGKYALRRSAMWPVVMRAAAYRFSADPGNGQYPALEETSMVHPNGTTRATSEVDATTKLRDYGYTVLETRNGLSGAYVARGVTRAAADSLYSDLGVSRVISRAHEVLYAGLQKFYNYDPVLNSNGTLADEEMSAIRDYLNDRAVAALVTPKPQHASRVVTTVSQSNVLSSDRTLNVLQEVQIKGQIHTIAATLSATGTITITV